MPGIGPRSRGYALLVMMLVLLVASLTAIVGRLDAGTLKFRQAQITGESLQIAREALIVYAATYRDDPDRAAEVFGYLPCPDGADKTGLFQPGDGTASGTCGMADQVAVGLLPYKSLHLPDLRDADGNCLWYAVSGTFKNSPRPTTPLNWDTQGQLTVLDAAIARAAPDDSHGGAAAIVFAPGPALAGQVRTVAGQPCHAHPAETTAYLESVANRFVQGGARAADGTPTNNDTLVWITPRDIFSRIVARADFANPLDAAPPGQVNRLIDAARRALESRLWTAMAAMTTTASGMPGNAAAPIHQADYTQYSGKQVGDLPELKPLAFSGRSYDNDFDNWQEQFRYVACSDLKPASGCLALGAQHCRGALLFGGRSTADVFPFGGPRPSTQKPHLPPPSRASFLAHYFEAGSGLDLLAGPALAFTGAAAYAGTAPAADVGVCLLPGTYATFAKDIAAFVTTVSSVARPEAVIDTATATLTLGNPAATAAGRGCAWLPSPLQFASTLRAYFRLRIADIGEGFVFAVADALNNQAAMNGGTLCGNTTGAQLGYSDGIRTPKFGLEFDTRPQNTGNCTGNNRNDPGAHHMAFVYWGTAASVTDDNCHNAGTAGSGAQPQNPRTLTGTAAGIKTVQSSDPHLPYAGTLPLNTDIHVRLDVAKRGGPPPAAIALTLKAYVASDLMVFAGAYLSTCSAADLRNLAADLPDLCEQNASIEQDDVPMDADAVTGAALATIYAGFTNAQSSGSAGLQRITIYDFAILTQ